MLGAALFGAIFILPLFASLLLGYTALQIGLVLLPAAIVSIILFPVVGRLGNVVDPRILMLIGIAFFTASLVGNGFIGKQTSYGWLVFLQMLRGASLPFLFTSVGALALVSLKPQEKADGSSLFNLTRTLGGSLGIAIIATTLVNRQKFHFERFGESVTQFGVETQQRLSQISANIAAHSGSPGLANIKATAVLYQQLTQQAYVSAFDDVALALAVAFAFTLVLIPMFKTERQSMQQPHAMPATD
jgi:DHA2 family multidrug resistance protein